MNRFRCLFLLPLVVLASCSSGVVRMPDAYDGQQIDVASDEVFKIELGSDRTVSNDPDAFEWVLLDPGVMRLISEESGTRPEDENEFIGGYSRYTVYTFEPAMTGVGDLVFGLVPRGIEDADWVNTMVVNINATH